MEKILVAQFIAHLVADFIAQPECISENKQAHLFRSPHIYMHTLIVFISSALLTFTCDFVVYAAIIAVVHFGIDALKCVVGKRVGEKSCALFATDQILHFVVIYLAVLLYHCYSGVVPEYLNLLTLHEWLVAAGMLVCLKPANVLIQFCFYELQTNTTIANSLKNENLQRAGHWIGSIERMLTFVLILLNQFTAIGFIIAAKSILRYRDHEATKTEYVLIGTLLSLGIAFALGVGVSSGVFEYIINLISRN